MQNLQERIVAEVPQGGSVIDIGSGMADYHVALQHKTNGRLALLDAHLPYMLKVKLPGPPLAMIVGTAESFLPLLADKAFDVALAADMPEHLHPLEALELIRQMYRIAKKVVLFIPEGNHPQTGDAHNMGGSLWQTHRSTWNLKDNGIEISSPLGTEPTQFFSGEGWTIERWEGFHRYEVGKDPNALFIVSKD